VSKKAAAVLGFIVAKPGQTLIRTGIRNAHPDRTVTARITSTHPTADARRETLEPLRFGVVIVLTVSSGTPDVFTKRPST